MKKIIKVAVAASLLFGVSTTTQAAGWGLEANGARSHGRWGGELGAGYRAGFGAFDITPAAGAFVFKGDSNGYFETEDRNGTERCRAPNGQFADKDKCNRLDAKAYLRLEAGVTIPLFARVAVGGRLISGDIDPYGSVALPLGPKFAIKGNAGPHYGALGVTFGF
ncbi:hypothetical protein [uncultured Sphingomonas sp.]|uniref:hypothetical protein n=1 Tax=uncultured Sphingomonas sp. TaxID=158754 RepID=UPI0025F10A76|nr:hypothetical protein [uncultured Sphingomonas sp.]